MAKFLRFLKLGVKIGVVAFFAGIIGIAAYIGILALYHNRPLSLPLPTGQFPVGRIEVDWVDQTRVDPLAGTENLRRELAVWIWYPAQAGSSEAPAPYLPAAWSQARDKDQGAGILIERELTKIQTHSFEGAPIATSQKAYPILIMQPGMGPVIPDYTVFAENLASHGYIVVGLNPTYTSNLVVFTDGRVVLRTDQGTIPDSAGPSEADAIANRIMAVWEQDVLFAMDQLAALNANQASPFYNRLDVAHIGVFGHSFGGATAILVCQVDPRCMAGADLDGTPFSIENKTGIPIPFLFMTEDYSKGCDENCSAIRKMAALGLRGNTYDLSIGGAQHFNFSDLPLRQVPAVRPIFEAARYTGSIDPARGEQIVNAYLLAFFDRALKSINSPLINGPSPEYPEVKW